MSSLIQRSKVECDAEGCGWSESIEMPTEEWLEQWRETPCPKCGEGVILTDEDTDTAILIVGIVKALDPLHTKLREAYPEEPTVVAKIKLDSKDEEEPIKFELEGEGDNG